MTLLNFGSLEVDDISWGCSCCWCWAILYTALLLINEIFPTTASWALLDSPTNIYWGIFVRIFCLNRFSWRPFLVEHLPQGVLSSQLRVVCNLNGIISLRHPEHYNMHVCVNAILVLYLPVVDHIDQHYVLLLLQPLRLLLWEHYIIGDFDQSLSLLHVPMCFFFSRWFLISVNVTTSDVKVSLS